MSRYLTANGINYPGTLPKLKKKNDYLQPIFEAFTNALESIKSLGDDAQDKKITINIFVTKNMLSSKEHPDHHFSKIEITDTGVGFNDTEFIRLENLNDTSKGFRNKGSGRVQFIHAFDTTEVSSIYKNKESSTGFSNRIFTLSKSGSFLQNNAIIRLEDGNESESKASNSSTTVTFKDLLTSNDSFFNTATAEKLKVSIIKHYLVYFCEEKDDLPEITITKFIDDVIHNEVNINSNDIPDIDKERDIEVRYSALQNDDIVNTSNKETLNLKAFKISNKSLDKNELRLVSKGESAKNIKLENLLESDQIDNNRYLFLLSGAYIDDRDGDTRGEIKILNKEEFIKQAGTLLIDEQILLEDIEDKTNSAILTMYDEIRVKNEEKEQNIEELKKMFLLNPETLSALGKKIGVDDSDDTILKKVYQADAKIIAEGDAKIKHQINELDKLDTTQDDYSEKLKNQVDELVQAIPLQNKVALTHYVARRKLVLELFKKIIRKELQAQQKNIKNIDERLLHNLIFQQSSDNPEDSGLWLINEDFIYFKGVSESQLGSISLNNKTIIKDSLSVEEEAYRSKQKGDAKRKRPDILLFPTEQKCIIIEFKSLNVNVSDHINQINRYASLINNLSKDTYNFTTYYGYLIGENIDIDDIQDNDSDFISAHQLDFIFRPHKRIVGKFGKTDGSLYTEVIKYSTLLERALIRNQIFIDKITKL